MYRIYLTVFGCGTEPKTAYKTMTMNNIFYCVYVYMYKVKFVRALFLNRKMQ
jgi:hypothetical protein